MGASGLGLSEKTESQAAAVNFLGQSCQERNNSGTEVCWRTSTVVRPSVSCLRLFLTGVTEVTERQAGVADTGTYSSDSSQSDPPCWNQTRLTLTRCLKIKSARFFLKPHIIVLGTSPSSLSEFRALLCIRQHFSPFLPPR